MKHGRLLWIGIFVAGAALLAALEVISSRHLPHAVAGKPPIRAELVARDREFVDKYRNDPRPATQDLVGQAEMRLAYVDAENRDFAACRKEMIEAARVKGTGKMGADYGGVNDQAAYQAIVCLVPQHKSAQAMAEFRDFMKRYPLSPLVHAAFKRLILLQSGKPSNADQKLLQSAIEAQEKRIRFETTVCGPKAVAYLLRTGRVKLPGVAQPALDYRALSKLFGATDRGTSVEGLRKGLKKLGLVTFGWKVNRRDFDALTLPALLLSGDHYLALLEIHRHDALVYDPFADTTHRIELPALDSPDFAATVITFAPIAPLEGNF